MKRGILIVAVFGLMILTLALSNLNGESKQALTTLGAFNTKVEKNNPWTSLKPNSALGQFQFAVISDRTGGHRQGIFSKAVQQINLLQPEFVMSVGDLIEGSQDQETNRKQWTELNGYLSQFQMPFFYVPGNHDASNPASAKVWNEKFGRRNFSFTYQNCLFIGLNTNDEDQDDPKEAASFKKLRIGKSQLEQFSETLKQNPDPRWIFIFLHHPIWNSKDLEKTNWPAIEKLLRGKKYNVFCGHVHSFRKYLRNNNSYYQLATTGGGSSLRGAEFGEFDQVTWITMKDNSPVISHISLQGIYKEDLSPFVSDETGKEVLQAKGVTQVAGKVLIDGKPAPKILLTFTSIPSKEGDKPVVGNARTNDQGNYELYSNRGGMGIVPGKYRVSFIESPSLVIDLEAKPEKSSRIAERYQTSVLTPIEVEVPLSERKTLDFDLK